MSTADDITRLLKLGGGHSAALAEVILLTMTRSTVSLHSLYHNPLKRRTNTIVQYRTVLYLLKLNTTELGDTPHCVGLEDSQFTEEPIISSLSHTCTLVDTPSPDSTDHSSDEAEESGCTCMVRVLGLGLVSVSQADTVHGVVPLS